jgi:uncharacterized membrane protein
MFKIFGSAVAGGLTWLGIWALQNGAAPDILAGLSLGSAVMVALLCLSSDN